MALVFVFRDWLFFVFVQMFVTYRWYTQLVSSVLYLCISIEQWTLQIVQCTNCTVPTFNNFGKDLKKFIFKNSFKITHSVPLITSPFFKKKFSFYSMRLFCLWWIWEEIRYCMLEISRQCLVTEDNLQGLCYLGTDWNRSEGSSRCSSRSAHVQVSPQSGVSLVSLWSFLYWKLLFAHA